VNSVIGYCSANANFNPEQYTFNVGQTIFVRFEGPATRKDYYIQYFNAPTGGTQVASSPALYSRKYATYDDFQLITAGWAPGNYRVRITKSGTWTDLGVQYFKVQVPGNLVATLTIAPTEVYVGDTFTVSLATTNNISTAASTITTATPSALTPVATSTGSATLVSGPTPSSVSLAAGDVATITWTYNATADSGAGDYALTALLASSITGIDINTGLATGSNKCVSNNLKIYKESLDLSVTTWDLGSGGPGDTLATVSATLTNGGNSDFTAIRWSKYDFAGPGGNSIPKSYSILDPDPVGSLASGSNMPVYSSLIVPYGQATGTYIATMSVFEDKNGSTFRDFGEAFDMFNPKVLVLPKTKIVALTEMVDFGVWPPDNNTATMPVSILSAGNISLASVKIRKTNGDVTLYKDSSVISQNPGPMAVMQTYVASFGIYIPPAFASGLYIATYTAWDDVDGDGTVNGTEASDTFQGRVNIGNKKFTCDFSPVNAGNATPPQTISGLNQRITNTGELNLTALKANFQPLIDGFGHSIATDNIDMAFPASIASGASATCLVSLYVPAGQYVGTYSAVQQVYEDGNGNGVWDTSEASSTFTLSVHVNPSAGIQVLVSTVDLGDMSAGGTATATFDCRNSGNTDLSGLRWEKVVLQNGGFSIATGQYWFPPSEPFFATAGAFFTRDLQITVPVVQDAGLYTGSSAWLFDSPDAVRDVGEPQDSFVVTCRVGTPALDILEPTLTTSGNPATFSATFPFNVKNIGQTNLLVPRATGTALIGSGTISGSQNVFTPNPLPYIAIGATGAGAWKVSIPPLATAGLYIATMTVWNDANSDQIQQSSEASDTARLELTVNANRVLSVVQNPLDLGLATAGSIVNGTIEIRNDGNIDLTNIRGLGAVLTSSFDSIPAANATFTDPIGALAIGASILATVTVTIGDPRFSGTYNGNFQVYDDYNTANGAFDSGSEEFASFPVTLQVGQKALSVTNPVAFGTQNPGATYNQAFNVSNTGDFDLSQGNWKVGSMTYGALTIPAASLTFTTPAAPFSLAVSETKPGNAQVVVDIYQPPGDYVGTSTAWADEDWDGTIDPNEASGTFQTTLTVATYPGLNVIPFTVACGNIAAGGSSAEKGFQY